MPRRRSGAGPARAPTLTPGRQVAAVLLRGQGATFSEHLQAGRVPPLMAFHVSHRGAS